MDFDDRSGLPAGRIEAMVEGGGTYWIRTRDAVAFYDGYEWIVADSARGLPPGRVTSLARDEGDRVLVVKEGKVFQGDTAGFRPFPLPPGLEGKAVKALPTAGGGLIATVYEGDGTTGRAIRIPGKGGVPGPPDPQASGEEEGGEDTAAPGSPAIPKEPRVTGQGQNAWRARSGRVWVHTGHGLLRWSGRRWSPLPVEGRWTKLVGLVLENRRGQGMAFREGPPDRRSLLSWSPGQRAREVTSEGRNLLLSGDLRDDGQALMLWETGDVRFLNREGWKSVSSISSSRTQGLYFAYLAENGDVWLASSRGLHWFRDSLNRWTSLSFPFPDLRNRVHAILSTSDGAIWIGTQVGLGRWSPTDPPGRVPIPCPQPRPGVTGLARDSSGGIWAVSGSSFQGAYRWDGEGWTHWGAQEGLMGEIHDVAVDREGSVWFLSLGSGKKKGAGRGVYRLQEGRITRWMDPEGFLESRAYAFAQGPDGAYWFGTLRGLTRWKEGRWTHWGPEEGLRPPGHPKVFSLTVDSAGTPWFGGGHNTRTGLGTLDPEGSIHYLTREEHGLPSDEVWDVELDEKGRVWFSTNRGVGFLQAGGPVTFDATTGLSTTGVWPLDVQEGMVLLGTTGDGVARLSRDEEGEPAPRPRILSVLQEEDVLHLTWGAFAFNGQMSPSRVPTRFRLDDGPWFPWGTERSASIPAPDAGRHTVTVQARGLFGQLGEDTMVFTVPPPLLLSPEVAIPVAGLVAAFLVLAAVHVVRKRRGDEALRESEERFRALVEGAPEAIALYDPEENRLTQVNANGERLVGYAQGELRTMSLDQLHPPTQADGRSSRERLDELVEAVRAGDMPVTEWLIRDARGKDIPCELRLVGLPYGGRSLIRISLVDISTRLQEEERRRELEEHLFQAQKLEAVGQLTGGVAHDFNNLLTVVRGNLELLAEDLPGDPDHEELRKLTSDAARAAERGALLTQRLLAFSRRQNLAPRILAVPELVQGLLDLIRRTLGETIAVETRLDEGVWPILADPAQLESALLNLAINARDAMPEGGTLTIGAENTHLTTADLEEVEARAGPYVVLSVTDDGVGMAPDVAARAVEPFFTTKDVGKGSGLGLSMVYGFTRQSGGLTRIRSRRGVGTSVRLYFPRATAEEAQAAD